MSKDRNQTGFTLVELLVTMVIMGVVVAGMYNLFRVHNLMAARQDETTKMQQELLSVMIQMTDDLRMCGYAPFGGVFGFDGVFSNSTVVNCTSDRNENGILDANSTDHIAYRISGNSIEMYDPSNSTWSSAASNISALRFLYFDEDGNAINPTASNADTIRVVEISAQAIPSPERSSMNINSRNMTTQVFLRNVGL
jgi:prepilin-type N-terminal cleavage/methylation domain-containing protein